MSVHNSPVVCPFAGDSFGSQEEEIESKIRRFSSRRRSRINFTESQCSLLERTFSLTHYPDHQMKREIAFRLGIPSDRVTVWFQNRRSKWRRFNSAAAPGFSLCPTQKRQRQQSPLPPQHQNALFEESGESLPLFGTEKEKNCQNKQQRHERDEGSAQNGVQLPPLYSPNRPDSAELATPEPTHLWTNNPLERDTKYARGDYCEE
ncbi:hypothetical protein niasHS_007499 [Heterodera schachtii]|uniref:Homeobox domain-containing protein n=1 Tax=Heterodera schachtii TaxID=97005 RepID=A0ABD2JXN2_HETSC